VDSREQRTLQSLKEMEISLEDTAVGRKKIVLEQQLNAATLSITDKVKRVIGDLKAKMG
jgi:hypothetical protein